MDESPIMKSKIILFFLSALVAQAYEPYNSFIEKWEGRRYGVYIDSTGNPTIGVGFNLKTANDELKRAANSGRMTDEQINHFLEIEVIEAKNRAIKLFSSFHSQPEEIKLILVDLSYNLGNNRLKNFIKFRAAINGHDYKEAARELIASRWFGQVGRRSRHHVEVLLSFSQDKS